VDPDPDWESGSWILIVKQQNLFEVVSQEIRIRSTYHTVHYCPGGTGTWYSYIWTTCLDHKPEWVLYNEFVLATKNYICTCTHRRQAGVARLVRELIDRLVIQRKKGIDRLVR
jgi:hypothetical protein